MTVEGSGEEKALQVSTDRLLQAQELAKIGHWSLDLSQDKLEWSKEVFSIFGLDSETFGASLDAFVDRIHPDDREAVLDAFNRHIEQGDSYDITHRILTPDGLEKVVHERCTTERGADGSPLHSLGTVQDITDKETIRKELVKSEARFKALFDNSPNGILLCNSDGNIVLANKKLEGMFGYDNMELDGQAIEILVPLEVSNHVSLRNEYLKSPHHRLLGQGKKLSGRKKDGSAFRVDIELTPFNFLNEKLIIATVYDMSQIIANEQHLTDLVLQRTKDLLNESNIAQQANRAKTRFIADMSHEIRTPLNAIIGLGDDLKVNLDDLIQKGELQRVVEDLNLSDKHLWELVDYVLDLSKIEAGIIDVNEENHLFQDILDGVSCICRPLANKVSVHLEIKVDGQLSKQVFCDASKCRQIMINLASNAIRFTPAGKNVTLKLFERNEIIHCDIIDEGPGIPSYQQQRIFEAWEQEDTPSHSKGSGLGLAITNSLVKLIGGKLKMISTVGKGSTFSFSFPVRRSEITKEDEFKVSLESLRHKKVLIVDDNLINLKVLAKLLKRMTMVVTEALSGREALKALDSYSPDLIIMDLRMPEMDGVETSKKIISQIKDPPPILLLTADVFEDLDQEKQDLSIFRSILHKPVTFGPLSHSIVKILSPSKNSDTSN